MGYTHYWSIEKTIKIKTKMVKDLQKIIYKHKEIIQFESDDEQEPICNSNGIRFNGIDDDGHETFNVLFTKHDNFCKTARKPYDLAVCECLLIIKGWFGDSMELSSDGFLGGELDENWPIAIKNVTDIGYSVIENWVENNGYKKCSLTVNIP